MSDHITTTDFAPTFKERFERLETRVSELEDQIKQKSEDLKYITKAAARVVDLAEGAGGHRRFYDTDICAMCDLRELLQQIREDGE